MSIAHDTENRKLLISFFKKTAYLHGSTIDDVLWYLVVNKQQNHLVSI
jgi:hypothetical protein